MDTDPPPPPSSATKKPKFTPKAPPRRKTRRLLLKTDSSDDEAEASREFVLKVKERFGPRPPKIEKKSSGNVTMSLGDVSSSPAPLKKIHNQPKDENNKNITDSRQSVDKNIKISSSTVTKDGGNIVKNRSSSSSDDLRVESSRKAKKVYKEPWNYEKYHPVSLPWRPPGSGDPEILNAQEFGQEEEYDEEKINSALDLRLLEKNEEKQWIVFKFPPKLPLDNNNSKALVPISSKGKEKMESSNLPKEEDVDFKDLPNGFMGKMLVYKSGAIKLKLGDTIFDVSTGASCECAQDVAIMDTKNKNCCVVGLVEKQAVVTPNLDSVLDNIKL